MSEYEYAAVQAQESAARMSGRARDYIQAGLGMNAVNAQQSAALAYRAGRKWCLRWLADTAPTEAPRH